MPLFGGMCAIAASLDPRYRDLEKADRDKFEDKLHHECMSLLHLSALVNQFH